MTPLKTVIVGFGRQADTLASDGRMARYFPKATHAAVLADHPSFDWAAVVDPSAEARERARSHWGVPHAVPSLGDLPDADTYTCAVIATPPDARTGILELLRGLRAVLLEKPLAASLTEAERLAKACEARGIRAQVNYWRRAVPGFRALSAGGLEDLIGAPQAAFGLYGGGLRQNGSHLVDFVRMLLGEVALVHRTDAPRPAPDAVREEDFAVPVCLTVGKGVPVRLLPIDFRAWREVSLDIWGRTGRLAIEQEGLLVRHFPCAANRGVESAREIASDAPRTLDVPVAEAFTAVYDNLAASGDGEALLSPLASALRTERVLAKVVAARPAA